MFGDKQVDDDGIETWEWYDFDKDKHLTWQQTKILDACNKYKKIAIASGRGIGKTMSEAMIIHWCLFRSKDTKAACTAPSKENMYDILWAELAKWHNRLKELAPPIYNLYEWQSTYFRVTESPQTWFASAKTGKKENPDALAGFHSPVPLLLSDEGAGVADEIYKVAMDGLTEKQYLFFMASNPRRLMGFFRDAFRDGSTWHTMQFNSMQSPLYTPSKAREIFNEERAKGEDAYKSARFRYEVLGEFPLEEGMDDRGYLPLVPHLKFTEKKTPFLGEKAMGIDPSGIGKDMTAFVIRDNFKARLIYQERISSPKSIAQRAITLMKEYDIPSRNIVIDNFGEGANVAKEIALAGFDTRPINVGDTSTGEYMNIRALLFWKIRQAMLQGFELDYSDVWKEEHSAIRYTRTLNDKIKMMSKEEIRKDGMRSPNAWDALSLSFFVNLESHNKEKRIQEARKAQKKTSPVANLFKRKI